MGTFSIWHWLVVLAVVLIIFGAGKLPQVMGDLAKGIKNFKQGMKEDETAQLPPKEEAKSETKTAA
ncbi:MAG: twin-arginine translocase TatA/TatE family subunit [Geminicoccaceae bacterium]|nr:twin-arginine translocase TatA/TatE family subunit [Geminicoccaceae bacterium]